MSRDLWWTSGGQGQRKHREWTTLGFTHQLILFGPVSSVTNCTEEDMETLSRRITGASLPLLKDTGTKALKEGVNAENKFRCILNVWSQIETLKEKKGKKLP